MSAQTRTTITTSPTNSTETTTQPPSTHYSSRTNQKPEREPQATRSKDSHLCITIRGGGPASGRPQPTPRAVDLVTSSFMIVSVIGWSSWC
jgi:hypothetical protein